MGEPDKAAFDLERTCALMEVSSLGWEDAAPLKARIAELEGMWTEIDVALCNAERTMAEHLEEPARLFYATLRDRLRTLFCETKLTR